MEDPLNVHRVRASPPLLSSRHCNKIRNKVRQSVDHAHALWDVDLRALVGDKLHVRANKRLKASSMKAENPTLVCTEAITAIQAASAGKPIGSLLWPYGRLSTGGWCHADLSAVIKSARTYLGSLRFVPHSLRHGGTTEIVKRLEALPQHDPALLFASTQMCASSRRRYTKCNAERKASKLKAAKKA